MSRDPQVPSPFGQQLRHWRRRSGVSQLDLAVQAGTSPRHVSFIETGRSRPGRDLVLRLAVALDVPIRDRNTLLTSAGLPPAYPDRELTDDAMRPVKLVLERVLAGHEPYPAWVVGRVCGSWHRTVALRRSSQACARSSRTQSWTCGSDRVRSATWSRTGLTWSGRAWPLCVARRPEAPTRNCSTCFSAWRLTRARSRVPMLRQLPICPSSVRG
jgi:transcriptional regulator with XRE-family HTH domain